MSETAGKRQRGRPRSGQGIKEADLIQSLDRALTVLDVVAAEDGLSLTEVATRAGLAPSTAYRMLMTLQTTEMVEFDDREQLWAIGVGAFAVGSAFLRRRKLVDRARPVMQRLGEAFGETVNVGISEGGHVVFVSQIESHEAIRAFFRPGTRSPLHASGIGKAILSWLEAARVEALVSTTGLERYTDRTLISLADLAADLDASRERGWAIDDEERNVGMRCVAAAIFNEFAEPVAGLSISGPAVRMTRQACDRFGPVLADAAAQVTKLIGGRMPGVGMSVRGRRLRAEEPPGSPGRD